MDLKVANWIFDTFGSNDVLLKIASVLTYLGDEIIIISTIALLLIFKKTRKIGFYAMVAALLSFLINHFGIKMIIARERPFTVNPEFLEAANYLGRKVPTDYSMASGHSLSSMTLAVSIFMFNKKAGVGAISLSIVCGITRMLLCVHYLTDVVAGFMIGAAFAIGIHYLLNFIIKKYLEKKGAKNENNSFSNRKRTQTSRN